MDHTSQQAMSAREMVEKLQLLNRLALERSREERYMYLGDAMFLAEQAIKSLEFYAHQREEEAIRKCAAQCDVDWPHGMPAQAIEYKTSAVLKERILALLPQEVTNK